MTTYNIDGKEFSEETIKEALKKHCNFEKTLKHGDFGYFKDDKDDPCLVENYRGELILINESYRCNIELNQEIIDNFEVIGNVFDILKIIGPLL